MEFPLEFFQIDARGVSINMKIRKQVAKIAGLAAILLTSCFAGRASAQTVATPTVSSTGSWSAAAFTLQVSCSTPGSVIHYTTNGEAPTLNDLPVTSGTSVSVQISHSLTFKAAAWVGGTESTIFEEAYEVTGAIDGGAYHGVAIQANGNLYSWGDQANGRLGNGSTAAGNVTTPTRVLKSVGVTFDDAAFAAGGLEHTIVIDGSANAWGFGDNTDYEVGNNSATSTGYAVRVLKSATAGDYLTGVSTVSAGNYLSLASGTDGSAWAWGSNDSGRTGVGSTTGNTKFASHVTVSATANLSNIVQVSAGQAFGLALDGTGGVWAWGSNADGQLGQGTTTDTSRAVRVKLNATATLNGITDIATGWNHCIALMWSGTNNGTVWCWGEQANGRLGNGQNASAAIKYPVQVTTTTGPALTNVIQVAAGTRHSLALDASGNVWAWGYNQDGNIGDGTTTNALNAEEIAVPTHVGTKVIYIGAGGYDDGSGTVNSFSYAIGSDGAVYSWGYDGHGELGNAATSSTTNKVATNYPTLPHIFKTYVTFGTGSTGLSGIFLGGTNVCDSSMSLGGLQSVFVQTHNYTTLPPGSLVANPSTLTVTSSASWGVISVQYSSDPERVYSTVTVKNNLGTSTSGTTGNGFVEDNNTIDFFFSTLYTAIISGSTSAPAGVYDPNLITSGTYNNTSVAPIFPGYYEQSGTIPAGALVVADELLPSSTGTAPDLATTIITFGSNPGDMEAQIGADTYANNLTSPIPPGSSLSFELSIGAEAYGCDAAVVRADTYSRFVNKIPVDQDGAVNWPTGSGGHYNAALARLFLTDQGHFSSTNLRCWNGAAPNADFAAGNPTTAECETFRSALLASGSSALANIQTTGTMTQGVIIWDGEGQYYEQTLSYIGDPRLIEPDLGLSGSYALSWTPDSSQTYGYPMQSSTQSPMAPEMDYVHNASYPNLRVFDEYVAIFKNAGYKIGMTLRPDLFLCTTPDPTSTSDRYAGFQYDPNGDTTLSLAVQRQRLVDLLEKKIYFAMDRWGATIFYVDSNSPDDAGVFKQVVDDFYAKYGQPVLLIPEWGDNAILASTARYRDWEYLNAYEPLNYFFPPSDTYQPNMLSVSTPFSLLRSYIYPNAYTAIAAHEQDVPPIYLSTYQAQLKAARIQGDIIMYPGWYYNVDMQDAINAYQP